MKILFINTLYFPNMIGGAERSVQNLAETLAHLGHTVFVVCLGKEQKTDVVNGVNVYYLKLANIYWPFDEGHSSVQKALWYLVDLYNLKMAAAVGNILDEIKPDLVHTNNLLGFSVAVWNEAKKRKIPIIHTTRDMYLLCIRCSMFRKGAACKSQCFSCGLYSRLKRIATKNIDHVVGISNFILNQHQENNCFVETPSSIIYNGYKAAARDENKITTHPFRFGYLGSILPTKGVGLLVDTYLASPISSNAQLIIAGEGYGAAYTNEIKEKTHGTTAKLAGRVQPSEFFKEIDVLVVPSVWGEPLGRVIIEAYAHGIPVVVSNRGGAPEIVEEGITGYLFEPDIPSTLTMALENFANNPELAQNMTFKCLAKAKEFLPDQLAEKYLQVYRNFI